MTDKQTDFQAALRLSGIEINENDIPLIFELAKACENNQEVRLADWARVFAEYATEQRKDLVRKSNAVDRLSQPRQYTEITISKNERPPFIMAC